MHLPIEPEILRATATDSNPQEIQASGARRNMFDMALVRVLVLLALFSAAAIYESRHLTALGEYDIWWHVRTGSWMLQSHTLPHSGLFSQYSARPWIAYSWGFEVIAATVYKLLELRSIPVLLMCFEVALAVVTFRLARGSRQNFWPAVWLSSAGQYALPPLNVRPVFLSMIFFGVELMLLFKSRRTGSARPLFWLPLLFAFWANLHIQFVYGLFVLGLFLAALLVEQICQRWGVKWFEERVSILPARTVAAVTGACFFATLLTPYFYHPYEVVWNYVHSTATYSYIVEMHAMNFRSPEHYVRLLLTLAAFFSLGCRRSRNLFQLLLMTACAVVAFRMTRDTWFVVLPSIAVIAEAYSVEEAAGQEHKVRTWDWEKVVTSTLVILVFVLAVFIYIPASYETLLRKVGEAFPVQACNFIRENHLPAPLFNPLNWGGFLIWYMPEYPVAIDGRTDLYGDEIVVRQYKVLDGQLPPWQEPTFAHARTFLLWKYSWLAGALSQSPGYKLVYEDDRAVVLVKSDGDNSR